MVKQQIILRDGGKDYVFDVFGVHKQNVGGWKITEYKAKKDNLHVVLKFTRDEREQAK